MKVIDVMREANEVIAFPWTITKLEQAGLNPAVLLMDLGYSVGKCKDCKIAQLDIFSMSLAEMEAAS